MGRAAAGNVPQNLQFRQHRCVIMAAGKVIKIKLFTGSEVEQLKAHNLPRDLEAWLMKQINSTKEELKYSSKQIKSWELVINTCQKNSKPKSE